MYDDPYICCFASKFDCRAAIITTCELKPNTVYDPSTSRELSASQPSIHPLLLCSVGPGRLFVRLEFSVSEVESEGKSKGESNSKSNGD
jgi:hypothetical protein